MTKQTDEVLTYEFTASAVARDAGVVPVDACSLPACDDGTANTAPVVASGDWMVASLRDQLKAILEEALAR